MEARVEAGRDFVLVLRDGEVPRVAIFLTVAAHWSISHPATPESSRSFGRKTPSDDDSVVSVNTVRTQVWTLVKKIGVINRREVVERAEKWGLF